ncbi:hypothetical protein V6N13_081304 [Hibiscus sabdariffa]
MIQGSHDEQFSRVYDYFAKLRGLVGADANDCVYPLAYAIVESENRSSWTWFLQILEIDMELTNSNHYTFMSDKKKELVDAIIDVFPYAEHRTCVRHLYSNFKLKNGNQGKALKDVLWKAMRATYMKEFTDAMSEMRSMSDASFKWLHGKNPRKWSKSHFSTRCKSDMLLNNMSESFNKMILESRDKLVLTMMEIIRSKIMTIIFSKKEQAEKINCLLCPKIQKKLDYAIGQSIRCWPRAAGANNYKVSTGPIDQHVVNLKNHACRSRKWDLTSTGRLGKTGVQMSCSKYGKTCHNKRSCKGQIDGNVPTSNVLRKKVAPTSNVPRRNIDPTPSVRIQKLSVSFLN